MTTTTLPLAWVDALAHYTHYLQAGARSAQTVRLRTHYIGRFARDNPDPWGVTADQCISWMAAHDWGPQTRRSARAALVGFGRWAVLTGRVAVSPAAALPSVLVPRTRVTAPPDALVDAALARASDRDRLMLMLASRAGLRRGEIAGLAWVDVSDTSLIVRAGKGGHARVIPCSAALAIELGGEQARREAGGLGTGWRYQVDPSSPWVFPAQAGGPMSPDTVGAVITRAMGGTLTAHDLRRRFATRAYAGTRDLRAVQELLGHASITTTQLYVAVSDDDLAAAMEAAA